MPSAKDIPLDGRTSFLLIGDPGTKKTTFIGTCPGPVYIVDCDANLAPLAGRDGIDYDTFKEVPPKQKLADWQVKDGGWYEYGKAWPAIKNKLNEIGKRMDTGTNAYKTIGVDSLTLLTDLAQSYIYAENPQGFKDMRNFWGVFLSNMSEFFGQLTAWPVNLVLTAHVKRDENLVLGTTEKLPNVPGQFAGKVGVYFNEAYYTEWKDNKVVLKTKQDSVLRHAKSSKFNVPDGTEATYQAIMKHVKETRGLKVA